MPRSRRSVAAVVAVLALSVVAPSGSAEARSCRPVVNPYDGSRFDGVSITRIRAQGVSCTRARQVARGAHFRALRIRPPASGVRRFRWGRWRVTGDLAGRVDHSRGRHDLYLATARGGKRVTWRF